MDDFTKNVLVMQISLLKQQIAAIESVILAATAPKFEKPITSGADSRVFSDQMDKEIGELFEQLKPTIEGDDDL
jgi:hypothetical protein